MNKLCYILKNPFISINKTSIKKIEILLSKFQYATHHYICNCTFCTNNLNPNKLYLKHKGDYIFIHNKHKLPFKSKFATYSFEKGQNIIYKK